MSGLEESVGTAPAPVGDCADAFESDAASPGLKGGMESAKAAPARPTAMTRAEALRRSGPAPVRLTGAPFQKFKPLVVLSGNFIETPARSWKLGAPGPER